MSPDEVLEFWFGETALTPEALGPKMRRWFQGGVEMDAEVSTRFSQTVEDALAGRLDWGAHPDGWLAEILVLDQLTRSVLRDEPRMYSGDARAQALALDGLDSGRTHALPFDRRHFAIMPLLHAEDLDLQERVVREMELLIAAAPEVLRSMYSMGREQARKYRNIIAKFGRFPHRNLILGRTSTHDEEVFLRDWDEKSAPQRNALS